MFVIDRNRSGSDDIPQEIFDLAGSTGNVYQVNIGLVPSCTCPDYKKGNQCKHIVYVNTSLELSYVRPSLTCHLNPDSLQGAQSTLPSTISTSIPVICKREIPPHYPNPNFPLSNRVFPYIAGTPRNLFWRPSSSAIPTISIQRPQLTQATQQSQRNFGRLSHLFQRIRARKRRDRLVQSCMREQYPPHLLWAVG